MKTLLRTILALLLLLSSSQAARASNVITFLEKGETLPSGAARLKMITMTGNDPAKSCAAFELRKDAQDTAAAIGANLIREETHRQRTREQPCDEITFGFYKVTDIQSVERRFSWTAARPLVWEDFKGGVPANAARSTAAGTSCGIATETNTVTSTNAPRVYVFNTFQTTASWVRPGYASVDILEHEQGHWNICELYTRKMRARFAAAHITLQNLHNVVSTIFNDTQREYGARQEEYERATEHGVLRAQQQQWTVMIEKELAATPSL